MPGQKRRYLNSPNPVNHIHDGTAPAAEIVDGVASVVTADAIVEQETPTRHLKTDGDIVPVTNNSDVAVSEGVSAGAAAAAEMIASHTLSPTVRPQVFNSGVAVSLAGGSIAMGESHSHSATAAVQAVVVPPSPVSNRDRFIKGFLPARTCCNLDLIRASAGTKFNLAAICIAVFPKSSNPDRRYIQLADVTGSVGVTLWNENVNSFSSDSVGRLVSLAKIVITNHNGKKALSMARDSSVQQVDDEAHTVSMWWKSLLVIPPLSCGSVHDVSDNSMVSVCGILGHVSDDTKMVQGVPKTLMTLHLVDSSGQLTVRSWNHTSDSFKHLVNAPILI